MAVLTETELLDKVKTRIGEDTSDEALAFIEDVNDTLKDMSSRLNDTTDWKAKYEQNDAEWRDKYKQRFFDPQCNNDVPGKSTPDEHKTLSFEELFKEEK